MSLAIDVDKVVAVLLNDGWHDVIEQSFALDAYEFEWFATEGHREQDEGELCTPGNYGVSALGFMFRDSNDTFMAGPVSAILSVRLTK
jgi:hypothetical protein